MTAQTYYAHVIKFEKGEGNGDREGTYGRVVVQRDERVHLEAVQEDLDHHETRRFELGMGRLRSPLL